jgi:hypothetical protein
MFPVISCSLARMGLARVNGASTKVRLQRARTRPEGSTGNSGGLGDACRLSIDVAKDIRLRQAWVAIKSGYFLQVRKTGGEPWAWWPTDVAASIAALPLGVEPRQTRWKGF